MSLTASCPRQCLNKDLCSLDWITWPMLIITSQPRPDRLYCPVKYHNVLLSVDLLPAVVGKKFGVKVSWLDAGSLDTEPGHLLMQHLGVDGYSRFCGAV